jgi:hypothetical protein
VPRYRRKSHVHARREVSGVPGAGDFVRIDGVSIHPRRVGDEKREKVSGS